MLNISNARVRENIFNDLMHLLEVKCNLYSYMIFTCQSK